MNPREAAQLSLDKLMELADDVRNLLRGEKQLIEVDGRVAVVGDTHGDLQSSVNALRIDADFYVFLGDYVDRGPQQLANINYLLSVKLEHPDKVVLLRGNHESPLMNYNYGFYYEVARKYGADVYRVYAELFSLMPYSALINSTVFAVHGGIARRLSKLEEIEGLPKGDLVPSNELAFEILWNDPDESVETFSPSPRGEGVYLFGRKPVVDFLESNGLEMIVRAHEYFPSGIYPYFDGKVISLFSCRYYPATTPKAVILEDSRWEPFSL